MEEGNSNSESPPARHGLFETAEALILDREDRASVVKDLAKAVVAQEVTRMAVTSQAMDIGPLSGMDQKRLAQIWTVLAEHYDIPKYRDTFEAAVRRLQTLPPDQATAIVHEVRRCVGPTVNEQMERRELSFNVKIPYVSKVLGPLKWTVKAPRVALRRFVARRLRFVFQLLLWLAAIAAATHWTMWTMFDTSILVETFSGLGKLVQFLLVLPAALVAWALCRRNGPLARRKVARACVGLAVLLLIAGAWGHWFAWVLFDVTVSDLEPLELGAKIIQPVFVLHGVLVAWLFGRLTSGKSKADAVQDAFD